MSLVSSPAGPILTLILAFDGVNLLDLSGPLQTFEASEPRRDAPERYQTMVASVHGGEVQTSARMPIVTKSLADVEHLGREKRGKRGRIYFIS